MRYIDTAECPVAVKWMEYWYDIIPMMHFKRKKNGAEPCVS